MKKFIKYTSRIVLGLLTIFLGLLAYVAYLPDESYHHCEAGQKDADPIYVLLLSVASLIISFGCGIKLRTKALPRKATRSNVRISCNQKTI